MNIGWKEAVLVTLIILLSCLTVFFSTRYYRNELILLQSNTIQQQQVIINETNRLLNEIKWSPESITIWKNLGYVFPSNSTIPK